MERKIKLSNEQQSVLQHCIITIIAANDNAHSLALELVAHIKKTPFYKQQVKKTVTAIEKDLKNYTQTTMKAWEHPDFYSDFCENIADELRNDYQKLEYSIKFALDKGHIDNSDTCAKIETARCITIGACLTFDKVIKKIRTIIPLDFRDFRLTSLAQHIDQLSDLLYIGKRSTVNLNDDTNCKLALRIISKKLAGAQIYLNALENLVGEDTAHTMWQNSQ